MSYLNTTGQDINTTTTTGWTVNSDGGESNVHYESAQQLAIEEEEEQVNRENVSRNAEEAEPLQNDDLTAKLKERDDAKNNKKKPTATFVTPPPPPPEDTHLDVMDKLPLGQIYSRTGKRLVRSVLYSVLARLLFGLVKSLAKGGLSASKTMNALQSEVLSMNPIKWGALVGGLSSYRALQETIARLLLYPFFSTVMGVEHHHHHSHHHRHHVVHPVKETAGLQTLEDEREAHCVAQGQRELRHYAHTLASAISALSAGALVSFSYRAMNMSTQTELSLYMAVRAVHSLCAAHLYRRVVPLEYQKVASGYLTILVMCLSNTQILYGLVFEPACHPAGYTAFLRQCTLIDTRALETVAALHRQVPNPESVDLIKNTLKGAVPLLPTKAPFDMARSCDMIHHGMSCEANLLNFAIRHFTTFSLPLYVPLKLTTTLVFGYSKAIREPIRTLWKITKASMRSAGFLTVFCIPATAAMCTFGRTGVANPLAVSTAASIFAGLATYLEPEGRRLDLALYCTMQAARHAVLLASKRGVIDPPKSKHIHWLSAFGLAVLFYLFDHQWTQLHPNVRKALQWLTAEKRSSRVRGSNNAAVDDPTSEVAQHKQMSLINPPPKILIDDLENLSGSDYTESLCSTMNGGTPTDLRLRRIDSTGNHTTGETTPVLAAQHERADSMSPGPTI